MADIATGAFGAFVTCWDHTAKYRRYIRNLSDNLNNLKAKVEQLECVYNDVVGLIEQAQTSRMKRTDDAEGWLKRVENLKKEAGDIDIEGKRLMETRCLCGICYINCRSRYRQSKLAEAKTLLAVEEIQQGRNFATMEDVAYTPDEPLMVEVPLDPPVGLDSNFDTVWQWVLDENVKRIGIYGMGGVGKTTLLKKIHNRFNEISHDYNVIAWIVVSRPANPIKIQEVLWEKLHLAQSEWDRTRESDKAGKILAAMNEKNFLLFLDDTWEEIDLSSIGIPFHSHKHKSKIIFTTRSEEVCGFMGADREIKMECLAPDKALELFRGKVGERTWNAHFEIPKLAESLVKECKYLPLALITVGATMASRKDPLEWRCALQDLRSRSSEFPRMEEKVLSVLEFSYQALPNDSHQKCFLYCSIFPEDHEYEKDELINLWIAEGFLAQFNDIHEARDQGFQLINNLTRVCLLENAGEGYFRMHDVTRDMAIWVSSEHGKKKDIILCQEKHKSFERKEVMKWKNAEKISLWRPRDDDQNLSNFPISSITCSCLSTLIIRKTNVKAFPRGFFPSMPSLKVLDLCMNSNLSEIPGDIEEMVNLQYLNLQWTDLRRLPEEVKHLTLLKFLHINKRCLVPEGVIPSLRCLRVFWWFGRVYDIEVEEANEVRVVEELNAMLEMEDVRLSLYYSKSVVTLLGLGESYSRLLGCVSELHLYCCKGLKSLIIPQSSMEHLQTLWIIQCELSEMRVGVKGEYGAGVDTGRSGGYALGSEDCFCSLQVVQILVCEHLTDLTDLIFYAPRIRSLYVEECKSMQEIITGDIEDSHTDKILSNLTHMTLWDLPELKSVCNRALALPSLESLRVSECPKLKKLPLERGSNSNGRIDLPIPIIKGDEEWWERLQWEDPQAKSLFAAKFQVWE